MDKVFCFHVLCLSFPNPSLEQKPWFGPEKRYMCHCSELKCDDTGQCLPGSTCQAGWFGPECQYVDLAYGHAVGNGVQEVADGNDQTCLNDTLRETVTIFLPNMFHFIWLRLHGPKAELLLSILIQFQNEKKGYRIGCHNPRYAIVSNRTVHVYCSPKDLIGAIILTGTGVATLCSVNMSGGRNVALGKNTTQSSTLDNATSDRAVNGEVTEEEACASTDFTEKDSAATWTLRLTRPSCVTRYVIHNRRQCCQSELSGFRLTSYNAANSPTFFYQDKDPKARISYTIIPPRSWGTRCTSVVQIRLPKPEGNETRILSICEVEVYEDVCLPGKKGLECDEVCLCSGVNEVCLGSTGVCASASYFPVYATDINGKCPRGSFGPGCIYVCRCARNKCDENGQCVRGASCVRPWFGPGCQYQNVATSGDMKWLSDGDDTTCNSGRNSTLLELQIFRMYTWFRIVVNDAEVISFFWSYFNITDGCDDPIHFQISDLTVDVYCYHECGTIHLPQLLSITGKGIQHICSLYVSGGRDFAIKQATTLSTEKSPAWLSVDGKVEQNVDACSKSATELMPLYHLQLSQQRNIFDISITNPDRRLQTFLMTLYTQRTEHLYQYKIQSGEEKINFKICRQFTEMDIRTAGGDLALCEVELFGETVCPDGRYGLDCEHTCNFCRDSVCFPSTGACVNGCSSDTGNIGCKPVMKIEKIKKNDISAVSRNCTSGFYGHQCTQLCPESCYNKTCERTNGSCYDCKFGFFGPFCTSRCPDNCLFPTCDIDNGACDLCAAGYQGRYCNKECDPGYYDQNCSKRCLRNCLNDRCDSVTGACSYCAPGFYGDMCLAAVIMDNIKHKTSLWALISCAAILPLINIIWCCRRWAKKKQQKSEEDDSE